MRLARIVGVAIACVGASRAASAQPMAPMPGMDGMGDMPGMDGMPMPMTRSPTPTPMSMDMDMPMSIDPLGLDMTRDASGTAWAPDATRMAMHHLMTRGWMLMLHYSLHGGYDWQGNTARGDDKAIGLGWVMGMASHALAGGNFTARAMLSPEALLLGVRGYPLLLQSGEEVDGVPLHDRQHPHDLFMELALRYAHAIGNDVAVDVYAAPAGEPALGPVAFPHRPFALYDMTATLGHHWEDSTHISFGVLTAGVYGRTWKLEGSWFNGREPDQDRYDLNLRVPDSYSGRFTVNPSAHWSGELSYGYLAAPEQLAPTVSQQRAIASLTYAGPVAGHHVDVTAVLGHVAPSTGEGSLASLVEANAQVTRPVTVFGRVEALTKTGADLDLPAANRTYGMGAVTLGAVYELPIRAVALGIGAAGTLDVVGDLATAYGTHTPLGAYVYVEAHPQLH